LTDNGYCNRSIHRQVLYSGSGIHRRFSGKGVQRQLGWLRTVNVTMGFGDVGFPSMGLKICWF